MRTKSQLINWLGSRYRYTSYLEVASPTTGRQFQYVSKKIYSTIERIMYRTPPSYDDGMIISCRSPFDDSSDCFKSLIDQGRKYDLVFVDPFHSYEASRRDLELALLVLDAEGTLVVHDCNPPAKRYATPHFTKGIWWGETYLAFLDIVRDRNNLQHCVVDMDCGCGVIRWNKAASASANGDGMSGATGRQMNDHAARPEYYCWEYFDEHRSRLLNLKRVHEFKSLNQKPA